MFTNKLLKVRQTAESLYVKTRQHSLFQHESRAGAASLARALLENAVVSPRPATPDFLLCPPANAATKQLMLTLDCSGQCRPCREAVMGVLAIRLLNRPFFC